MGVLHQLGYHGQEKEIVFEFPTRMERKILLSSERTDSEVNLSIYRISSDCFRELFHYNTFLQVVGNWIPRASKLIALSILQELD